MLWLLVLSCTASVYQLHNDLEEQEHVDKELDGYLSFPLLHGSQSDEQMVGTGEDAKCTANGLFCRCGFQSVKFMARPQAGNLDCYELKGVCQHCGKAEDRVSELGFDYKYLAQQKEDVYRMRVKKEDEIWAPPQYNYKCAKGFVVTGIRSKYSRVETLGDRDFYTLKIKCSHLVGAKDPNLQPGDWKEGTFPWIKDGEKPGLNDLLQTADTKYAGQVGHGTELALEQALEKKPLRDRKKKDSSRRLLTVDPELMELLDDFNDYIHEDLGQEEAVGFNYLDLEEPVGESEPEMDLKPVPIEDDFFNLDDDAIVEEFLHQEQLREQEQSVFNSDEGWQPVGAGLDVGLITRAFTSFSFTTRSFTKGFLVVTHFAESGIWALVTLIPVPFRMLVLAIAAVLMASICVYMVFTRTEGDAIRKDYEKLDVKETPI